MELIRQFSGLSKDDAAIAGGKGASLGEMSQAGIPVPPGFVILSTTFDQFLKDTDLLQEVEAVLVKVDHQAIHTVDSASEQIRELIESQEMPKTIGDEITSEFKKLGAQFVAVRSSATAEDGADHAWAGQLESYLNTNEENLLTNVKKCWASLFTPRAIFYRFEKGLHKTHISVAVVIQKMVQSEKSGIAFSVHPVTEDYNQLIIEAGFGLGEAIVSGSITPDSYVVEKSSRNILDINVSEQTRALYKAPGGGNEWKELDPTTASSQVLSNEQVLELAELVLKIENHYGFPCDIEWAYEGRKFYVTQSRPITTLSNKSVGVSRFEFKKSYSRDTTLFMQGLWAKGLTELSRIKFGWHNPHLPFIAHFVNDGVVEIWEHEPAVKWLLDMLLAENKKGPAFLQNLFGEYRELLEKLSTLHDKDSFSDHEDVRTYTELVYQAAFVMTMFFYTGMDERSPKETQDISVAARKEGDFFAENDVFVRNQIARMSGLSQEQAGVVLPEELGALPNVTTLNKRLSSYLIVDGKEAWTGPLTDFVNAHPEYNFKSSKATDTELPREVSGQVAFKGKVRGVVRLVRKQRDMDKVKEGDILVSPMTTPDFLPAMQRAAAFVTNEGGVTCHAAIVAREMKKPCVIGTKIATHIFRDGDMVEVDAEKGIVTLVK